MADLSCRGRDMRPLLSIFFLVFNTFSRDQTEIKMHFPYFCSAVSLLSRSHFMALMLSLQLFCTVI